ncbi:MAG: hypothetical protein A3H42_04480 [Deltaproteobacteria bacterium RIFCSPLOWO2_02_FULL_46_8]|nr:MAG: hypothetical protein A3H42_04480 [Deltaproteobacteria bacterium RIFCSPLOWO2_02_FULL_46_8]
MKNFYVIEKLGVLNWFFQIWPRLSLTRGMTIYVIDASNFALKLVRFLGTVFQFQVEKLKFDLMDVKDEKGLLIRLKIPYEDLPDIQREILEDPVFKEIYALKEGDSSWKTYVAKSLRGSDLLSGRILLSKTLFLIHVCLHGARKEKISGHPCLYLNKQPWQKAIARYGKKHGVHVFFVWPGFSLNLRNKPWRWLKCFYSYYLYARWCLRFKYLPQLTVSNSSPVARKAMNKIAVDYYGHFNLDKPAYYSDFFFWQESDLSAAELMGLFYLPGDPLDEKKWVALQANGIEGVVLEPRASRLRQVPPYLLKMRESGSAGVRASLKKLSIRGMEKKWAHGMLFQHEWWYHYWKEIFKTYHAKIYVSWYKYDEVHCALGSAIRDEGGLLAIYQRALDLTPFAETQLHSDLYFASSSMLADVERCVGSKISYFVVTGYLGDHRFPLLKEQAKKVRHQLCSSGASYVVSFTDENSGEDPRWQFSHAYTRANYLFLLEKLLQNPWMGLVLKPKIPRHLRKRLGEVDVLLQRALKTGRCFLYDEGSIQGAYPPAVSALSADIAIHGHLCGPTAAMEAALVGTPTLLLDLEGWPVSPLYQLGERKVVFKSMETIWEAIMDHRHNPSGDRGIGSWGSFLDQLDPFRDGKAARRMGTYLKWLIEGFNKGQNREEVLMEAAQRYQKIWGKDKVISIG